MSIKETAALPIPSLPDVMLEPMVRMALLEDLGRAGDLTTDTIVPADAQSELRLMARQDGVLAGLDLDHHQRRVGQATAQGLRDGPRAGTQLHDVVHLARRTHHGRSQVARGRRERTGQPWRFQQVQQQCSHALEYATRPARRASHSVTDMGVGGLHSGAVYGCPGCAS